jgi:hypothetical protein
MRDQGCLYIGRPKGLNLCIFKGRASNKGRIVRQSLFLKSSHPIDLPDPNHLDSLAPSYRSYDCSTRVLEKVI